MNPQSATSATEELDRQALRVDRWVRGSTIAVVVLVAAAAGYVSYQHAYELIHSHGESGSAARIGPGTVDGVIYASGMVLLQAARYRQRRPRLAVFGLWLGIAATIGANVAHGIGHGPVGALVSAWPGAALIVAYELLMKLIRTGARRGTTPTSGKESATKDQCPHAVAATAEEAVVNAWLHGRDCLGDEPSQRQLAAAFDVKDRKKLARWISAAAPVTAPAETAMPTEPHAEASAPSLNGSGPA